MVRTFMKSILLLGFAAICAAQTAVIYNPFSGQLTVTKTGGGVGSGCVPAGTIGQILTDSGAGACTSNAPIISGSTITASLTGHASLDAPVASPTFTGTVTIPNGGVFGTPTSMTATNVTGLPVSSGVSGLGTGIATALGVNVGSAGAPVLFNGALGTPSSGTATNLTGLPISTGVSGLGTGVATALAINVGTAGAPVVLNGAGGTPSSLTLTNATGLPAAALPNAGVFTGDATTTFPALTIGNAAITAAKMVNAGVFTGDVTTTFPAITVAKVNGISYSATAAAHSVEVITSANTTATAKVIPDCTDSAGNHINYTQSTDAFSCGTTASVAGTVTSVGFTGGLISVGTPTTTPAFTVAGTSGGIPYFSGASTWASSGAGVQNAMVTWGGAGNAPTSPLSLLVTNQNSATETWTLNNTTASTGITRLDLIQGAGETGGSVLQGWKKSDGTLMAAIEDGFTGSGPEFAINNSVYFGFAVGSAIGTSTSGALRISPSSSAIFMNPAIALEWSGTTNQPNQTKDVSLQRDAAGILSVSNGSAQNTTAANYRAIAASAHYVKGTTFTASGCSNGTLVGGATAGKFTLGANNCTVTVTMGNSATASNGWFCSPQDQTTAELTAGVYQSSSTTTTAVFTVPATAGSTDVIGFACIAY